MKASELIQYLQNKVGKHGDFEIYKELWNHESWNHFDAIYEGLYPYHFCLSFYDKEKLKEKEAENTKDLANKYKYLVDNYGHPDRDIYKNMKEGEVVAVMMR